MLIIASRAPVSSPTPIICVTIVGNTGAARIGVEMVPPFATEARTSFIAFSTTLLPEVLPTISIASSIGTPAATSAENVREKRAMQTFCTMSPIFHGTLSLNLSHCIRPDLGRASTSGSRRRRPR